MTTFAISIIFFPATFSLELPLKIENVVALVTGSNYGIGPHRPHELLALGTSKVFAGARTLSTITKIGVEALRPDVTNREEVADAEDLASDITLVINKAGIAQPGGFLTPGSEGAAQLSRLVFSIWYYAVRGKDNRRWKLPKENVSFLQSKNERSK